VKRDFSFSFYCETRNKNKGKRARKAKEIGEMMKEYMKREDKTIS
jgi:hypothetical protein